MIGWFNSTATDSNSIQASITGCQNVSEFDAENQTFKTDIAGSGVYDFNITRGMGFFIKVDLASTRTGQG